MDQSTAEVIQFDAAVYSVETVKKAAYRFLDRCAPNIKLEGQRITCHLSFPKGTTADVIEDVVSELKKEVLDQDLRQLIANETADYRNAILALAFSSSKLTKV